MRKYQPGNPWLAVTFRPQRKLNTEALAEVCAQKSTNPCASTFGHRKNDDFPARKCTGTAAKIAPGPSRSWMPKSRARDGLIRGRKSGKRSGRTLLVDGWLFRGGPGQRLRCYFDRHSARAAELLHQNAKRGNCSSIIILGAYWLRLIVGSADGMSRMVRWPR